MHLIKHLPPLAADSRPVLIRPGERGSIDDLRKTVGAVWLKSRSGIRTNPGIAIEPVAVTAAGLCCSHECGKVSLAFSPELQHLPAATYLNHKLDTLVAGGPDTKVYPSSRLHFRADRQPSVGNDAASHK
jgi:hypothetical protein